MTAACTSIESTVKDDCVEICDKARLMMLIAKKTDTGPASEVYNDSWQCQQAHAAPSIPFLALIGYFNPTPAPR